MHKVHGLVIIYVKKFLRKIHKEQRARGGALARCLDVLLDAITVIHVQLGGSLQQRRPLATLKHLWRAKTPSGPSVSPVGLRTSCLSCIHTKTQTSVNQGERSLKVTR